MDTIQQVREHRNELARQARNMLDQTPAAEWKKEQTADYDKVIEQIDNLDSRIERHQKQVDLEADKAINDMGGHTDPVMAESRKVMAKWMRKGDDAVTAEEWQAIRNTMSTTTDAQGGYTVAEEVATSVIEAMKALGGMRAVANSITTANGVVINFPTSDYTSEIGEIIAQNQPATDLDPSFGTKSIGAFKYSSKVITVPFELLQDSSVDIEAFVLRVIARRLGLITNQHFTTGVGTTEPQGIVTAATVGKAMAAAAVTYDDLLDLEHSVDPAYRQMPGAGWMFNDNTLKAIRKLKDDDKRPLFLPSYDAGIRGGVPAELMGRPININQQMPDLTDSGKGILFGDFSSYLIRDVSAMNLFRFTDSAFTKKGQVGFLAWMRADGASLDVGGAVKAMEATASV